MGEKGFFVAPHRAVLATSAVAILVLGYFAALHTEFLELLGGYFEGKEAIYFGWAGWERFRPALLGHLRAGLVVAAIIASAWQGGSRLLDWMGKRGGAAGTSTLAAAGLGLVSLAVFALGISGLLYPIILLVILGGFFLSGFGSRRPVKGLLAGGPVWPWVLVGFLLFTDLASAMSYEYFQDSLVYHLALPERFLAGHRFVVMPGNMLNFLPLNTEMLYLPCLAFGGEECAKLLNMGLGILLALSVAGLARRIGGEGAGWAGGIAAFLAVSMPLTAVENEMSFADNSRTLWELLALRWFITSGAGGRKFLAKGDLAVSAVFAGFAMGSKYLSFIECALLAVILFVSVASRLEWRFTRALHAPALFVALALLVASPWLVRNTLAAHNPVYPFGHGMFNSLRWSGFEQERWMNDNRHYGVTGMTFGSWVTLPFRVTMDRVVGEFGTFTTGPLLLGLVILLFMRSSWPWTARVVAGVFLGEALVWSLSSHLLRYLYPGLMMLCALLGWVIADAREKAGHSARTIMLVLALWSVCAITHRIYHRINLASGFGIVASFMGKMDRGDVQELRGYGKRMEAVPPGKILLVGEERALGIGRVWEGSSIYNIPVLEWWVRESADSRRLAIRVKQAGIRAVLLNGDGFKHLQARGDFNLSEPRMAILNGWWKTLGVVFAEPPVTAYAVPPFTGQTHSGALPGLSTRQAKASPAPLPAGGVK